jgi:hypothetical protein
MGFARIFVANCNPLDQSVSLCDSVPKTGQRRALPSAPLPGTSGTLSDIVCYRATRDLNGSYSGADTWNSLGWLVSPDMPPVGVKLGLERHAQMSCERCSDSDKAGYDCIAISHGKGHSDLRGVHNFRRTQAGAELCCTFHYLGNFIASIASTESYLMPFSCQHTMIHQQCCDQSPQWNVLCLPLCQKRH